MILAAATSSGAEHVAPPLEIRTISRRMRRKQSRVGSLTFIVMWMWIGMVSCYDVYLTILYQEHLRDMEQNPIARAIMSADNWNISSFIGLKMAGTIICLGFLMLLFNIDRRFAYTVTSGVAFFQFCLFCYLTFA